jgi:hypothetical protein
MLKPLLAAALLGGQAANVPVPAPTRCISRAEIGDLTLVGASVAVEVVRNACRSLLPATAFLATPAGADFAARMRAEGQRRLDAAMDGIARISGGGPNMPRATIRALIAGMMSEGAGREFAARADAPMCRDANEIMEIASTLSPDQMARFVGAFASIADHVARMRPPPAAAPPAPPGPVPAPRTAPPETAPPTPHPAAFEAAPDGDRPTAVLLAPPATANRAPPGTPAAPRPPRAPFAPFLCPQPQ